MIKQLQKYPKAWGEFVEWVIKQETEVKRGYYIYSYSDNKIYYFNLLDQTPMTNRQLQSYLIEWLDSKEYYVHADFSGTNWLSYVLANGEKLFVFEIINNKPYVRCFADRLQATEAGILQAFNILEGHIDV